MTHICLSQLHSRHCKTCIWQKVGSSKAGKPWL